MTILNQPLTAKLASKRVAGRRLGDFGAFASRALFWSWNLVFLVFVFFGLFPIILWEMWRRSAFGTIAPDLVAASVGLVAVPVICVTLGLTLFRNRPTALFGLFYGIEAPVMLGILIRFFFLQQLNPAVATLLAVAGAGMLIYLAILLRPPPEPDQSSGDGNIAGRWLAALRLAGATCSLAMGLYVAAWLGFYVAPVARLLGQALAHMPEFALDVVREDARFIPLLLSWSALAVYTGTLLVLMPLATFTLHLRAWWRESRVVERRLGVGVPAVTLAAIAAALIAVTSQPQHAAFAALGPIEQQVLSLGDDDRADENRDEVDRGAADTAQADGAVAAEPPQRVDLRGQEETIRSGLVNAYLAPFRYLSAEGSDNHLQAIYERELDFSPETAASIQAAYLRLTAPLHYQGESLTDDQERAAALYRAVFDVPLQEGERAQVLDAVRSTWSIDDAEAGILDVGERRVHLVRQEIEVTEHGDWADVEIHEIYHNMTQERQEIFLFFSLPETAVVTGLWLNDSPDLATRFPFQVAPRGAAQEVYKAQVRRSIDPALLEQVGPGQYRLRVFPIEPPEQTWDEDTDRWSVADAAPPMHLWLTYNTLADAGTWPLPRLSETRNLFWDHTTDRFLNGARSAGVDDWMPPALAAENVEPRRHVADLGSSTVVVAPYVEPAEMDASTDPFRLAVVVDRSGSMGAVAALVDQSLAELAAAGHMGDVYLTSPIVHPEDPSVVPLGAPVGDTTFFGGSSPAEVLAQFGELERAASYDAILVLTDDAEFAATDDAFASIGDTPPVSEDGSAVSRGTSAASEDESAISEDASAGPARPSVWFVHLDGRFPPAYDDATLEYMQASGGGAVASVAEALARIRSQADGRVLANGYRWEFESEDGASSLEAAAKTAADDPSGFDAIAARQLVQDRIRAHGGEPLATADMDEIHALAVEQGIVTPYSSMIVLVNDEQRRQLAAAEQRADRFDREIETGVQGLNNPPNPFAVTGVPEPEEWLLILLGLAFLAKTALDRRKAIPI